MRRFVIVPLLLVACGSEPTDAGVDAARPDAGHDAGTDAGPLCTPASGLPSPLVCNGHAEKCDRTFDSVSYATAHNAMSTEEEGWVPPNQGRRLWRQLEDGVRAFMLDTYELEGETLLCHVICPLGSRPFVDALIELRTFMDCHPAEVLTLLLEARIDEERTRAAFEAAGLMPYLHEQPLGTPWPTLRSMIESGRRMLVMTQSSAVTLPWHHNMFAYAWDTPFANAMPSDFDCSVGRGDRSHALFILNHFLTAPVAMPMLADMVNVNPFFIDRARGCETDTGQLPNFVTVDFYDRGDLFLVVEALNGF